MCVCVCVCVCVCLRTLEYRFSGINMAVNLFEYSYK